MLIYPLSLNYICPLFHTQTVLKLFPRKWQVTYFEVFAINYPFIYYFVCIINQYGIWKGIMFINMFNRSLLAVFYYRKYGG